MAGSGSTSSTDPSDGRGDPQPAQVSVRSAKPWWRRWWAISLGLVIVLIGISAAMAPSEDGNGSSSEKSGLATQTQAAGDTPDPSDGDQHETRTSPASTGLTPSQQNAVRSARSYLDLQGFSRRGLIGQLSSEFGDKFSIKDATVAVDSLDVNWNAEAAEAARSYLEMTGFSCQGLIDQLSSDSGDKFTVKQATYGANAAHIC